MWWSALVLGFAGSLHCAGMCSPLAMTLTNMKSSALRNRLLYNLGRITMYGILGAIVTTIGFAFPFAGVQNVLSIVLGLILLILATLGITDVRIPFFTPALLKLSGLLKTCFSGLLRHKGPASIFFLGALNGILPCGLTFLALSFCLTLPLPLDGFRYMFMFGIGTLPVMLGLVEVFSFIKHTMHWNVKKVTTGLMILSGILLIARVLLVHIPGGHETAPDLIDIVICR